METFTIEEVIALAIIFVIVLSLFICIAKGFFKIAIGIFIGALLFGFGFGWLPGQIESINNGEKSKEDVINEVFTKNTIDASLNSSKEYYEKNKDNIFTIVDSAFNKIGNIIFPPK